MTTPVSFELANLLEKRDYPFEFVTIDGKNIPLNIPTIAEVVMWLYEKHGIWISAIPYNDEELSQTLWENKTIHISDDYNDFSDYTFYHSPTEAYEAAIEYTLKNLI